MNISKSIFVLILSMCLLTGCSQTRTERETTVVTTEDPIYPAERSTRTVETTTQSTESEGEGCGGVLSCTVDVIGSIIALPFKAVGALIGAIF